MGYMMDCMDLIGYAEENEEFFAADAMADLGWSRMRLSYATKGARMLLADQHKNIVAVPEFGKNKPWVFKFTNEYDPSNRWGRIRAERIANQLDTVMAICETETNYCAPIQMAPKFDAIMELVEQARSLTIEILNG